jgi:hypothetical protein
MSINNANNGDNGNANDGNANSADNAINANNVLLGIAKYQAVYLLIKPYCADKGSTRLDRPSLAIHRR